MKILASRLLWSLALLPALLTSAAWGIELPRQAVELVQVPKVYRLDGKLEATNRSTVSSQTSGQVVEVLFDVDDLVEQDAVLVRLRDTEQRAQVASAEANLRSATAQRQDGESEYQRIKSVFEKEAVSQAAMDKALAARKSTRASVEAARAALTRARQQLAYTEIRAPYTGIVTERLIEVGEVASPGQRLMAGVSLDQLRVEVDVPQSLINSVRQRQQARVWLNGQWQDVTEITVFPVADPATDTFKVRMQLKQGTPNAFPGMFVKVALGVGLRQVLSVPPQAVVYRSEVIGVYVVDDQGHIALRHIRVGDLLPGGGMSVLSGLDQGEQVIMDPHSAVVALKAQMQGQAVELRDHE